MKHIDSVVTTIKGNNDDNSKTVERLVVDFQEMKRNVIDVLDNMGNNLSLEGKAACKSAAMKNQDAIDEMNCSKNTLKIVNYLLESTVEKCSSEQAFVCLRELEHIVENIEKSIIRKGHMVQCFVSL